MKTFLTLALSSFALFANPAIAYAGDHNMPIKIESLPTLEIAKVPSFEALLAANEAELQKLNPAYTRQAGSDATLLLEAFSFRELALRAEVAGWVKQLFWMTATDSALEYHAANHGLQRAAGSYPTAAYTFALTAPLAYDVTIPQGCILGDAGGNKRARVFEDAIIRAGQTEVIATVELQEFVETSGVKTDVVLTPLPFVLAASANADFADGAAREADESLRQRIHLSFADKSTAGARRTYASYAYRADSRIMDVHVFNNGAGRVKLVYYAETMDKVMQQRLEQALTADAVRPLNDAVEIVPAEAVEFAITATVLIDPSVDASIHATAVKRLTEGLKAEQRIGNAVHLSDIIALLKAPGVDDVQVSKPLGSLRASDTQVLVASKVQISHINQSA